LFTGRDVWLRFPALDGWFRDRDVQKTAVGLGLLTLAAGCHATGAAPPPATAVVTPAPVPRELCKVVLPPYVVEPPDILMIDAVRVVPRPPYRLRTSDVLAIQAVGTLPEEPIAGMYVVEPGGLVRLGPSYGAVNVAGLTVEEAEAAVGRHLRSFLREPRVAVSLLDTAAKQQIAGEHLVAPDGTVTLGCYGSVPVVGMTLAQARAAIEQHLAQYLDHPEVSVDVFAYNSKVYYIVTQGAGLGDGVYRFPVTGNETVLDAVSYVNGLSPVSSKRIWIARPTDVPGQMQVLPVDWNQVTAQAGAGSNYQILPGDRVFIAEDSWIALDTQIAKITTPLERIMGFSLLGVGTATRFSGPVLRGGGNANANF
jgi:polysaccharide export outer membrane protein